MVSALRKELLFGVMGLFFLNLKRAAVCAEFVCCAES